jgi:hypothetical protein
MPKNAEEVFSIYGSVIRIPEFELFDHPVNAHPDMQAVKVGDELFIHAKNTALASLLIRHGIKFSAVNAPAGAKYPDDVALNLFTVKNYLFANIKSASKEILSYAASRGFEIVNVKQGYAKCSAMTIGDSLVTADISIYKAAVSRGIDALLISPGHVDIEKYDTGFIGGASCLLCDGNVCVFGSLDTHPDGAQIRGFAYRHGAKIIDMGYEKLFDYGGAVRIDT